MDDFYFPAALLIQVVPLQQLLALHKHHADGRPQLMGNVAGKLLFPFDSRVDSLLTDSSKVWASV